MIESRTSRTPWNPGIAAFVGSALIALAAPAFGQAPAGSPGQAKAGQKATPPVVHICGPRGTPSTLAYSAHDGWIWRAGWDSAAKLPACDRPKTAAVLSLTRAGASDTRAGGERPLTVFIDGPTGYAFVYLADEGWKFVGKVADRGR